jgi:hypothetical protein
MRPNHVEVHKYIPYLVHQAGFKDSEWNLVLKYYEALHRYIQTKMDFLDISSLGAAYRYSIRIEHKFKKWNKQEFGSANMKQTKYGKGNPNSQNSQPQDN